MDYFLFGVGQKLIFCPFLISSPSPNLISDYAPKK